MARADGTCWTSLLLDSDDDREQTSHFNMTAWEAHALLVARGAEREAARGTEAGGALMGDASSECASTASEREAENGAEAGGALMADVSSECASTASAHTRSAASSLELRRF